MNGMVWRLIAMVLWITVVGGFLLTLVCSLWFLIVWIALTVLAMVASIVSSNRGTSTTAPERVPAFMLRCQHCTEMIRLISAADAVSEATPVFIDSTGHILCDSKSRSRLLHRPMPSILG
jgi:hypothetical protein